MEATSDFHCCVALQQYHKVYDCGYFLGRKEGETMMLETKHFTVNPRKGRNCEPDFHQKTVIITLCWSIFMGVTIISRRLYLKDIREERSELIKTLLFLQIKQVFLRFSDEKTQTWILLLNYIFFQNPHTVWSAPVAHKPHLFSCLLCR